MSPSSPTVPLPRVRPDLVFDGDTVTDARFGRTLRPRPALRRVLDLIRAGVPSLSELGRRADREQRRLGEPPLTPDDLYRRLWSLARDLWFELEILPEYDRLYAWKPAPLEPAAPLDTSRAVFLCTGCGRCCDHTDIGPVGRAEAARIEGTVPGFGAHLTWVTDEVAVLGAGCERCPYRRDDGLCAIHADHGPAAKPLVCRQFPYRFTRVDGRVEASLDAECWQLAEALAAGRADPAAALADVRAAWAQGPVVDELPPVRFADPFTLLTDDDWDRVVAAFDGAVQAGGSAPEALVAALRAAPRHVPPFLDEAAWSRELGPPFQADARRQRAWALGQLERLLAAWTDGAPWRAPLGAALQEGARRLARGTRPAPQDAAERELFVRTVRSHLEGRTVLKKDNLELGLVFLYWRTRLAEAARGPTSAIDTLVASNKLPKDRRLGEYFRQNQVLFRRLTVSPGPMEVRS